LRLNSKPSNVAAAIGSLLFFIYFRAKFDVPSLNISKGINIKEEGFT
jgi:hypothetical protein